MKKTMKYLSFGALVLALMATWAPEAEAAATCFCKISKDNLAISGNTTSSGVCKDLTSQIGKTYAGVYPQHNDNQEDCNNRCKQAIMPLIGVPISNPSYSGINSQRQSVATACCALGAASGSQIYAFSAVGTKAYRSVPQGAAAQLIGTLSNSPAVTQTACPAGWLANMTNVNGGITADGKCKKVSGSISIVPLPTSGSQIGAYGFTWGNQVYAWGTQANGGAAVTTTISPAVCSF